VGRRRRGGLSHRDRRHQRSGRTRGRFGRLLPELSLSLAHQGDAAVALVRPGTAGCGIDIERVAERAPSTVAAALGPDERRLLAGCAAAGEGEAVWFSRFWAAKEAVAKAEGTGLRGRPQDFVVERAEPERLLVAVGGRRYPVRCARVRDSVVAWTEEGPPRGAGDGEHARGTDGTGTIGGPASHSHTHSHSHSHSDDNEESGA
jgi:phosphopantetheinyl transferase